MDLKILGDKCQEYFTNLGTLSYLDDHPLCVLLNKYDKEHPNLNSYELKGAQYEILAENMDVIVFPETPFYFINNLSPNPGHYRSVSSWLSRRNLHIYEDADPETWRKFKAQQNLWLFLCCGPYTDNVHFTVGVENLVKRGLEYYYLKIEEAKVNAVGEELDFLTASARGLLAAKQIAERYAERAEELLKTVTDASHKKNMEMLISAARRSPWKAPATFFEGISACWFARNVIGALEGVGNSTLGRVDYILYDLYRADIEAGRLTKDEAYELIKHFVTLGDRQYDKNTIVCKGADQEEEMGFSLGGCDPDGNPVYNDLTEMFIRAHTEEKCIYPKIHARFSSASPKEYLHLLSSEFASGRSVIGLSCDDGIIPGLLKVGKSLADARNYETVGCWENKIPAKESMPGGNYVYSLRILEQTVYGPEKEYVDAGLSCTPLDGAKDAEEVYTILKDNLAGVIKWRCEAIGKYGRLAPKVNPLCLSSALMDGCIDNRKDYTAGGAVYNENSCDVSGFANYVDAILAVKTLCFDKKEVTLPEYLRAVRANWVGYEELLMKARACPHFGDNSEESKAVARRLHGDLCSVLDKIETERGGKFFLNYYVYREYFRMAKEMRATPDGRRDGDYFAQGIGPSRCHTKDSLTDVVQSAYCFDRDSYGTSSLDLQLPYGKAHPEHIEMLLLTLARLGAKHIQMNCTSVEELKRAKENPENYGDLIVRVTGFSAKFVSLSEEFQNELISRATFNM